MAPDDLQNLHHEETKADSKIFSLIYSLFAVTLDFLKTNIKD